MDTNSKKCYDACAAHYTAISANRNMYLKSVDEIIIDVLKNMKLDNLLDIGVGDGVRSKYLSEMLGVKQVIAIESSSRMVQAARMQLGNDNVLAADAENVDLLAEHFDAVISLWNVFGHISCKKDRVTILRKISKCLRPGGKCIIDVNNRYNYRYYGLLNVVCNIFNDMFHKKKSGWFPFQVGEIKGKVYIHRPGEINDYLKGIDLYVERVVYIDYETGGIRNKWSGQCLYILSRC